MIDTQFCNPDGLCKSIKNPVQYAKKKQWMQNNLGDKPKSKKKIDKANSEKGAVSRKENHQSSNTAS
jgi:hypothetical protein